MTKRASPEEFEEEPDLFKSRDPYDGNVLGYFLACMDERVNGLPPHNSTPTSIQAASSKRSTAATERARVLAYIQSRRDGATREEVEEALGISGNSVRPRVAELLGNYGHTKVLREGPTTRKTKAGRNAAILWGS